MAAFEVITEAPCPVVIVIESAVENAVQNTTRDARIANVRMVDLQKSRPGENESCARL